MDLQTCEGLLIAAVLVVIIGILIIAIIILAIWRGKRCGRLFSPSIPFHQDLTDSQVDRPRDVRPITSSLRHTSRGETQPGVRETAATNEQDGGTLHRKERLSHKPSTQYSTRSSTKTELSTLDRVFHAPDVFRFSNRTNAGKQNKSSTYCKSRHPSQSDLLDSPSPQDSGEELDDEVQDGDSNSGRVARQLSVDRTTESRPKRRSVVSVLRRVLDVPSVSKQRSQTNFEMEDKRSKYDVSEVNPSRHLDDVSSDVAGAAGKCDTEQKQWRKRSLKRTSSNKRESLSAIFDRVLDVPKPFRRKKPINHDTEMTSVQPEEYDRTRHTSQADLLNQSDYNLACTENISRNCKDDSQVHHDTEMTSVQPEKYDRTRHTSQADLLTQIAYDLACTENISRNCKDDSQVHHDTEMTSVQPEKYDRTRHTSQADLLTQIAYDLACTENISRNCKDDSQVHHDTEMTSVQPEKYDRTRHTSQADLLTQIAYDLACTENISRNSKDHSQVQRSDSGKGTVRLFGKRGQDTVTECTSSVLNEVVDVPRVSKQSEGERDDTSEKEQHMEGPGGTNTYDLARSHVRPVESPSYGVEEKSSISVTGDHVYCLAKSSDKY